MKRSDSEESDSEESAAEGYSSKLGDEEEEVEVGSGSGGVGGYGQASQLNSSFKTKPLLVLLQFHMGVGQVSRFAAR